jgi:nitroreductase
MNFEDVIRERQATREFSNRVVSDDIITKILEAGRIAPTALNIQPFKIYVVKSEDGIKKMDLGTSCRYGAPVVLMICGDKSKAYKKGEYSTYEMDCSIVATHMMLEATNLGVDNIWIELFNGDILRKEFDIPENLAPVCLLPLGYRTESCPTSRNHGVRKELDDLVTYV